MMSIYGAIVQLSYTQVASLGLALTESSLVLNVVLTLAVVVYT